MSQVIIAGDTSGTITLQAPAVAGSTTLTLPTTTATLATLTTPSFASTIGVGAATASVSGAGISFPATQSASSDANTLDDYEEGTWTPGVTFGGGSTGMTFAGYQGGKYTKIGNRVFFTAQMRLTAKGSSTGTALLTGLPFASAGGNQGISSVSFFVDSLIFTGTVGGQVDLDAVTISIYSMISGGSATALTNTEFQNTTNVKMMGHYYTTS
jgi:hypothetical protein